MEFCAVPRASCWRRLCWRRNRTHVNLAVVLRCQQEQNAWMSSEVVRWLIHWTFGFDIKYDRGAGKYWASEYMETGKSNVSQTVEKFQRFISTGARKGSTLSVLFSGAASNHTRRRQRRVEIRSRALYSSILTRPASHQFIDFYRVECLVSELWKLAQHR